MQELEQNSLIRLLGLGERNTLNKILYEFVKQKCAKEFEPDFSIFHYSPFQIVIDDKIITLNLLDNAGSEKYSRLRVLSYYNIDIFLIVFQVEECQSIESFQNFLLKWYPELNREEFNNKQKIILGCRVNSQADDDSKKLICRTNLQSLEQLLQKQNLQYFEYFEEEPQIQNQILDDSIRQALQTQHIQIKDKDQKDEESKVCCKCF